MPHVFHSSSADQTRRLGIALAGLLRAGDSIVLAGDLGAGKTALVKGVAEGLGVTEPVTSPTFGILAVHPGTVPLNHFDLYRLDDESQLEDVGFFDAVEADAASFIEWGDRFRAAMPLDRLEVTLTIEGPDTRLVTACGTGPRSDALLEAWAGSWAADQGEARA